MPLGSDGEERSPTGSLFEMPRKAVGPITSQCRAAAGPLITDYRLPARTQAGRPFTLCVVRESGKKVPNALNRGPAKQSASDQHQ